MRSSALLKGSRKGRNSCDLLLELTMTSSLLLLEPTMTSLLLLFLHGQRNFIDEFPQGLDSQLHLFHAHYKRLFFLVQKFEIFPLFHYRTTGNRLMAVQYIEYIQGTDRRSANHYTIGPHQLHTLDTHIRYTQQIHTVDTHSRYTHQIHTLDTHIYMHNIHTKYIHIIYT